ncbi:MAG: hypothetical protein LBJ67_06870 [Planctomycetaceae bacterium]|jgi:hypothetical protein|nr:hypothetical protein [Planctomycetaceae bacterium]
MDYEYDFNKNNNRVRNFHRSPRPCSFLIALFGRELLGHIVYIQVSIPNNENNSLESIDIRSLHKLQHISISGYKFDKKIFIFLSRVQNLKSLDLYFQIFDSDIEISIKKEFPDCSIRVLSCSTSVPSPENVEPNAPAKK